VAGNAMKHGMRSAEWIAEERRINAIMREFRELTGEAHARE